MAKGATELSVPAAMAIAIARFVPCDSKQGLMLPKEKWKIEASMDPGTAPSTALSQR